MPDVYAADGTPLRLGRRLAAGGEGAVHEIADRPGLCAKVYHPGEAARGRREKLQAMVAKAPADPAAAQGHRSIAWPRELLFSRPGSGGDLAGFTMPLLPDGARTALEYMQPEDRVRLHPGWGFRHLLTASRNLAAAVAALHHAGYCIGDLNESNVMVADTALVTLIDCDSFQVPLDQGRVARCPVGRSEYTAPELVGRALDATDRTPASDAFALAVLVFQLLMQGYHPFNGRWLGTGEPPDVARRIRAGAYAYGGGRNLIPPPAAPPLDILPPPVREAFARAFGPGLARSDDRPSALQWVAALEASAADLRGCRLHPGRHEYPRSLRACPWCVLARGGAEYFPEVIGAQVPVPAAGAAPPPGPFPGSPRKRGGARSRSRPPAAAATPTPPPPPPPPSAVRPARAGLDRPRLAVEPKELLVTGITPGGAPRAAAMTVRNVGRAPFVGRAEISPPSDALQVTPERLNLSPFHGENEVRLLVQVDPRRLGPAWRQRLVAAVRLVDADGVRASVRVAAPIGEPGALSATATWSARVGGWGAALLAAETSARAAAGDWPSAASTLRWLNTTLLHAGGPLHPLGIWLWLGAMAACLAASRVWRLRRGGGAGTPRERGWRPAAAAAALGLALWPVALDLLVARYLHHPGHAAMEWSLGVAFVPTATLAARALGWMGSRPLRSFLLRMGAGPLAALLVAAAVALGGTAATAGVAAVLRALPPATLATVGALPSPGQLLRLGVSPRPALPGGPTRRPAPGS